MSYSTACCSPLRIRFSEIVLRSLAARIESMIVVKELSSSDDTVITIRSGNHKLRAVHGEVRTRHGIGVNRLEQ